jgi:hypothetical protein
MSQVASSSASSIKKYQYAALIREERVLLVWHDDLDRIIPHAVDIESRLLSLVSLSFPPLNDDGTNKVDLG